MEALEDQLAALSPDQRRLIERWLREQPASDEPSSHAYIPRRRATATCPLSFDQQQLWFLYQWDSTSAAYNFPIAVRLRGPCDLAALARSLDAIVQRHEALRTAFLAPNGQPEQRVVPHVPILLRRLDLDRLPLAVREALISHLARAEVAQPFDLEHGPLLRARVLRLDPTEHILLITIHHIVFDNWSQGILIRELIALYTALRAGQAAVLPTLPLQYADYALWQRQHLQGRLLTDQLAYWTTQLRDAPELIDLPTDHPRAPIRSVHGTNSIFGIPAALGEQLHHLSRQSGATLFMLLLAAFDVLLYRYSGQTDLVVGTSVAGRSRAELEGLIGMFVNRLALRTSLAGNPSVRELLQRVRGVALAAYAHQDIAFEQVLDALPLKRDLSRHPLFQTMLVLQNAPMPRWEQAGLTVRPLEVPRTTAQFDLALFVREGADGLHGRVKYSTDLFDPPTIQRMFAQFVRLLTGMATDPEQPIDALSLLSPAERAQLLIAWNATRTNYPQRASSLQGLFAAQAARTPDTVAVVFDTTNDERRTPGNCELPTADCRLHLTYGELNARSNQLAWYLRARGVGPEVRVGVCVERSIMMIVALLGVLKAGGAYVPLDPGYPAERISFMLEDSGATALITTNDQRRTTNDTDLAFVVRPSSFVNLSADWPAIAHLSDHAQQNHFTPEQLAYVIYTSGSTGAPKGVMVTQRGVVNLLAALRRTLGISAADRLLAVTTLTFDIAGLELYLPLISGAGIVLASREVARDGQRLAQTLAAQRVTMLQATPATWRLLLAADWAGQPGLTLLCGGEALAGALAQALAPRGRALWNVYGPTETTIWSSAYRVPRAAAGTSEPSVPIGRPLDNTTFYILDRAWQIAPIGVPGELCIGGAGLARGYLGRPDLTAERFIPNPFGEVSGIGYRVLGAEPSDTRHPIPDTRLYKTGDLARYRPDGTIEYLGRNDQQVKLRGFRIELGEIASVLARHSSVREVVVLARADHAEDTRLVAYVVPAEGTGNRAQGTGASRLPIDDERPTTNDEGSDSSFVVRHSSLINELRAFLIERLPDYMIPSAFVLLDALPLTPSGKIDRRALPEPDHRAELARYVAPRTPTEELLADTWADILKVPQIGVHDNFFSLGGHSLLATQVLARLRMAFQIELPLRSLFETPTLAALAAQIAQQRGRGLAPMVPPLVPQPRTGALPLSFAQERLWFLDQWEPGTATYNVPWPMRLAGRLDRRALHAGLNAVIQRHEALRTTFPAVNGQPAQQIAPRLALRLPLVDLQALPDALHEPTALRLLTDAARDSFDLAAGPLVRVLLLRLSATEHVFLLNIHHIICDGWSMAVFMQELAAFYRAFTLEQPAALPDLAVQYTDFAIWQRGWLRGAVLDAQLAYWRRQLGDRVAVLELPTDRPRPPVQTHRGAREPFSIADATLAALQPLCQAEGATRFMALLATFSLLLARYSGQTEIIVGAPIANRDLVEVEGLIGYFVNTLMLRTDLRRPSSFRALLRQVRDTTLDAHAHQNIPFEQLVEQLQPERDLSRTALFQVMFVLQNTPPAVYELPGLTMHPIIAETGTAKFDLLLSLGETSHGLRGALEYNSDLFDATTIKRMLNQFQRLLRHAAAGPAQHVMDLPLLSAAERAQVLVAWNQTQVVAHNTCSVEQLIADQAARSPDAVALVWREQHLTYWALDDQASRLAARLRARGVGHETLVGLEAMRSPRLIVALLGVLKAGAAYVPLDPAYPAERISFMLEDSGAAVLITTKDEGRRTNDKDLAFVLRPSSFVNLQIVDLSADAPPIAEQPTGELPGSADAGCQAYVIYTSGSTGTPKGVLVTRQGLANHCRAAIGSYELRAADRVLQLASLSFDLAAEEIYPTLASGATLVLWPHVAPPAPHDFLDLAERERLTVLNLPTPLWQVWAAEPASATQRVPAALRLVIVGGDRALTVSYVAWRRALPERVRWINTYGPTEATIITTLDAPAADAPLPARDGMAIGRPIANTQVYLLDARMQPVPVGVAGELHIGGAGLARGYLGRPDLTAERFVPNPFAEVSGAGYRVSEDSAPNTRYPTPDTRLYKTGDLARYLPDGTIAYVGRRDDQIKLRGYRIELGEVAAALMRHPAVREAVVVAPEDRSGEQRLVAYVVPTAGTGDRGQGIDERRTANGERSDSSFVIRPSSFVTELRDFLKERLPEYMIPAAFVALDGLPLTPTGKLDRKALPAPERRTEAAGLVAPRDRLELQLVQIWEELLNLRPIGVKEPFFALGGHSLLAVRLMARLRELTGLALPLATLFRYPTIEQLAQVLREQAVPTPTSALVPIATGGTKHPLYCIHPLGGNVLCYAQLARQLGAEQPVYGLQSPSLEHERPLPATVEAMAAEYVAAIRTFQPTGPYLLCGWSVGGLLALEIAQQLAAQEQRVAMLALLDSHATRRMKAWLPNEEQLLAGMARQLGLALDPAALQALDAEEQLAYALAQARRSDATLPGLSLAQFRRLFAVYKANARALLRYVPHPYAGRVALFRADQAAQASDPTFGWSAIALGGVGLCDVPGDHDTMLQEPHVRTLADRLTAAITQALSKDLTP